MRIVPASVESRCLAIHDPGEMGLDLVLPQVRNEFLHVGSPCRCPASRRDASSHWKIWIVQPDGTGLQKLGDVIALDSVWAADGNIVFTDALSGPAALATISRFEVKTGRRTPLIPASFFGDLNGDRKVDLKDLLIVLRALGRSAEPGFDPRDRNRDGRIGGGDLLRLKDLCSDDGCSVQP